MIGWEFPPFMAGGLGIHCLELTTELAKQGVEIDFYMPRMEGSEGSERVGAQHRHLNIIEVEAEGGLTPYGPVGRRGYDEAFNAAVWQYNQRVKQAFSSRGVDLVHGHDWITADAAEAVARKIGKPFVWTCHSTEHDRSAGFFPQQWIIDAERRATREADRVIAVSSYTRQQLIDRYGGDPSKIDAVHNGVDFSKFANHVHRDYARGSKNVLYLSRVSRQKGPLFFMQAARKVLDVDPSARFVVAGKGEMLPECVEYAVRNGMVDRVTFTGFVPDAEVQRMYEGCDVYVLPSVSEPFGISVLEAMTSGLPTIVSKTTGVGEALRHVLRAEYWDTHEMADQIIRVLDSKALREELGRNGALEVRKFTWAACGRRTLDTYRRAAGAAPKEVAA
ncbi:MAG TPA: glycosyltransferase family 4 protein [Candidatus Thermoplasmatota archaeon]|nr:glycosyltransferase family 4 protein [Candidatus Thermoplasmatota archaeon]